MVAIFELWKGRVGVGGGCVWNGVSIEARLWKCTQYI